MKAPLTLEFNGKLFRCAGYRHPEPGEMYVSKNAKVSKAQGSHHTDGVRLIVRELDSPNDLLRKIQ